MSIFSAKSHNEGNGTGNTPPFDSTDIALPDAKRPTPQKNRPSDVRGNGKPISLPLYIAGAAAQISGLAAVSYQIGEPLFAYFTIGLTLIGAATAMQMRRVGTPPRLMQFGALLLALIFLLAVRGSGIFAAIVPTDVQGTQELLLVSALAFTATFGAFLWLNDEAVTFSCVWSIAMIGLTGTVNINRELILSFIAFLAAATFLLVHQNTLAQSNGRAASTLDAFLGKSAINWELLRTQAFMAAIAWVGSLLLGFLIAIPVQMVGKNLSLNTIIQRLKVPPTQARRSSARPRLIFDNVTNFSVGIGPVDDDPSERLQVLTDEPRYWRGRTYDQYTGRAWINSLANQGNDIFPAENQENTSDFNSFALEPIENHSRVAVRKKFYYRMGGGVYGPLYHAAEPRTVRAPIYRVTQRDDNTISTSRGLGNEYEIESDVIDPSPDMLRRSGDRYAEDIRTRYLEVGLRNTALQQLALEAVQGVPNNPFDRAQALRRFISNRCLYTREAQPVPRDRDAAEFFLNESREGYCDLYATSMTVLCRYAGIPARLATGFAPGSPATADDVVPDKAPEDTRSWYILRGSDLHAWTEVYFVGYGWVPFDATQDTGTVDAPPRTPEPVKKKATWQDFWKRTGVSIVFIGLGVLGLLFVAFNELAGRFALPGLRFGRFVRTGSQRPANEIAAEYLQLVRWLARRGAKRPATMTPSEYLRYLHTEVDPSVAEAMTSLTRLTEQSLYGPASVTEDDITNARKSRNAVRDAWKAYKGRRGTR